MALRLINGVRRSRPLWLVICSASLVPALLSALTSYLNSRFGRGSVDWGAVTFAATLWLAFGALTPITYVLAQRYPLRREWISRTASSARAGSALALRQRHSAAAGSSRQEKKEIIDIERAALDRWGKGDPQGYLEIMATEVTYFDPFREERVDALAAMKEYLIPSTGKFRIDSYEMINPQVQRHGDIAILTFSIVNTVKRPDREEKVTVRWNSTEVYRRIDGNWKIIHSHWSFTKPELK